MPAVAQVAVPLPTVPRPPSNTDRFRQQQDNLNRLLEGQQKTRARDLQQHQMQEKNRAKAEKDRRWNAPVTPYDRPVGAAPLPPKHP